MFCQSQAFLAQKKPEKATFCQAFFDFRKKPMMLKKTEFQNLASKKLNWQLWREKDEVS